MAATEIPTLRGLTKGYNPVVDELCSRPRNNPRHSPQIAVVPCDFAVVPSARSLRRHLGGKTMTQQWLTHILCTRGAQDGQMSYLLTSTCRRGRPTQIMLCA